jgi:NAD+ kinase
MFSAQVPPKKFAIATHPSQPEVGNEAREIAAEMEALGAGSVSVFTIYDPKLDQALKTGQVDVLIALGGDGTMLRAGHIVAPYSVPVLGINRGRFGFLMEINQLECSDRLQQLIRGEYWLEKRMMIESQLLRDGESIGQWLVLNEVVVCRGQYVRPILLTASLDGYVLATYNADGLIAATPTGSTGYALAVGGPIMPPELRTIQIVPVAPHLSMNRPIILSAGSKVVIKVNTTHQAILSADGQSPVSLQDGDQVEVSASEFSVPFVRFQDPGYFYRNLNKYMEQNPITGSLI